MLQEILNSITPVKPALTEPSKAESMSIMIGKYEFFGPFDDETKTTAKPGILAVLIEEEKGFELLYLCESDNLFQSARFELDKHTAQNRKISLAAHYTDGLNVNEIKALKDDIMSEFEDTEGNT